MAQLRDLLLDLRGLRRRRLRARFERPRERGLVRLLRLLELRGRLDELVGLLAEPAREVRVTSSGRRVVGDRLAERRRQRRLERGGTRDSPEVVEGRGRASSFLLSRETSPRAGWLRRERVANPVVDGQLAAAAAPPCEHPARRSTAARRPHPSRAQEAQAAAAAIAFAALPRDRGAPRSFAVSLRSEAQA